MSTVGVDIGDWIYEKKVKSHSHGPVIFRTWDFGGQKEYVTVYPYLCQLLTLVFVGIMPHISISFQKEVYI